jgi:hypothetical protein
MIKFNLVSLAIGALITAAVGVDAQAAHKASNGPLDRQFLRGQPQPPAGAAFKLKLTYRNASNSTISVPAATFVPVDALTQIKCPGSGTCTIVAETSSQVLGVSTSGRWAICTYVDSIPINGSCIWQGQVADDWVIGSNRANYAVSAGNHQIQSFIYMVQGGSLTNYQFDYSVFIP